MARANPGRVAAARALIASERGAHVEDMLAELAPAEGSDRGLAWHLALGVLRRLGAVDAVLRPHLNRPLERLDPAPRAALRIGAFELCVADVASHAAVSQAVEVCRAAGGARASGLVNAVMRKVRAGDLSDDPFIDLPPWLADRWADHGDWVRRLREPAVVCGVWRDAPVPEVDGGVARAGGAEVPGAFVVAGSGAIGNRPGFAEGRWWVIDPSAVHVADLAYDAAQVVAGPKPRVLDACAAPGGKSLRMASRGAQVVAIDLEDHRLSRLHEGSERVGLPLQALQHDWLEGPHPELTDDFAAVLVDAPCTGLGTVRRHPEIRWRRAPSDPAAMALRQRRILRSAAAHVAPAGALIYAVCSPCPEEGIAVVADLEGWQVTTTWTAVPPAHDEDAHQAFVLHRTPAG